jgi:EPS-associated MarR family transcriptional regulator
MTTRRQTANDDTLFWTLKVLQENPGVTQRTLAKEVGINVSTINFCLKALVEKGWIKMGNFRKNPDKLSYAYMLTPTGVAEKTALTRRFLQRKIAEYEKLRGEIEALQLETEVQARATTKYDVRAVAKERK